MAYSREELAEHRDRLALRIEVEIFSALWGAVAAQTVAVQHDPQVKAGLDALEQAAELLSDPVAYAKRAATGTSETPDGKRAQQAKQAKPQ